MCRCVLWCVLVCACGWLCVVVCGVWWCVVVCACGWLHVVVCCCVSVEPSGAKWGAVRGESQWVHAKNSAHTNRTKRCTHKNTHTHLFKTTRCTQQKCTHLDFQVENSGRTVQYKLNAQSLRLFGLHSDVHDAHRAGANRLQNKKTFKNKMVHAKQETWKNIEQWKNAQHVKKRSR